MSATLPNTYQRVYYIQSSGTQWLDTGHKHTNNSSYELIVSFYTAPTQTYYKVFGAATSNYSSTDCIQLEADNNEGAFHFRTVWYSEYGKNFGNITIGTVYRISMNNSYSVCYDYSTGEIVGSNTYTGSTASSSKSDYLFTVNSSETSSHACSCRIYSFKIYSSGKLVCNLVPCYRKSDGVIGMYDLVNDSFKTNIGSGTFTKGDELKNLTYKNFKLCLGRKTETHEEWVSKTETIDFSDCSWITSMGINARYRHSKRYPLGSSSEINDVVIISYQITGTYKGCITTTTDNITYVQIYVEDNSTLNPTSTVTVANVSYSKKESTTVYIPESYKTAILGGQIFNIKSDVDIVPIPPIPTIEDIHLDAYMDGSTKIYVDVDNNSYYNIDVEISYLYIDTSSSSYNKNNWEDKGYIDSPISANSSNSVLLYFSDGCAVNDYEIIFTFSYNGVYIGESRVSNF